MKIPPLLPRGCPPIAQDEALNHLIPLDPTEAYSMHEVIEQIVDHGSFLELQSGFARNAMVGLARLDGYPVGIVAQEPMVMAGVIDIDSADKITRFVRLCDCYNLPIITFVDSPGFLPGVEQEHRGIIRHGAKVLYAYSEAMVPKISIVTRKAYGGAYVVMSSKYLGTDLDLGLAQRRNRGDGSGRRGQHPLSANRSNRPRIRLLSALAWSKNIASVS